MWSVTLILEWIIYSSRVRLLKQCKYSQVSLLQPRLNWLQRNSQWSQVFIGKIFLPAYLQRTEKGEKCQSGKVLHDEIKFKCSAPASGGAQNEVICWVFLSYIKWRCVPQGRVQQFILIRFRSQRASLNFYLKKGLENWKSTIPDLFIPS